MATYIRKNTDPSAWDAKKQNYDNFVNSIINAGEKIGDEDIREKEFFLKLADKGIELDDEAQTNISRVSKYFNGLGNWKKQKDETEAPSMTNEEAPKDDISKVMSELKNIDPGKNVMDQPKEQKKKLDLVKIASILDSGDYSKLKEEYPDEFNNMDVNEQENFLKNFSAGDEIKPQAQQEIPPMPGMGELRAFESGKINQVPGYEKLPEMDVLNVDVIAPKNAAIPPLPPIAQAPQEDQGDEYGSGYLGSLARYSKNVRDTKGYAALTQRLKALKNAYGATKDEALRNKYIAETAKIIAETDDKKKPYPQSREGQKDLFNRETRWQDPKNLSLTDLYKERMKKLKEGKSENPLEEAKFEFQMVNAIEKNSIPLRKIDSHYGRMKSYVDVANSLTAAGKKGNSANDYAIIMSFSKLLDEASVVRPEEVETIRGLLGVDEMLERGMNRVMNNELLGSQQRIDMLQTAAIFAKEAYKSNIGIFNNYKKLNEGNKLGIDMPSFQNLEKLIGSEKSTSGVSEAANRILKDKNSTWEAKEKARKALGKILAR